MRMFIILYISVFFYLMSIKPFGITAIQGRLMALSSRLSTTTGALMVR